MKIPSSTTRLLAVLAIAFVGQAFAQQAHSAAVDRARKVIAKVDGASIQANAAHTRDWPTISADYAETRFSKLAQVNAGNVKELGLVWSYNLESTRGVEATPLVVDGVMYQTASW